MRGGPTVQRVERRRNIRCAPHSLIRRQCGVDESLREGTSGDELGDDDGVGDVLAFLERELGRGDGANDAQNL
jgi:hypothetical protein